MNGHTLWLPPVAAFPDALGGFRITLHGFTVAAFVHLRGSGHIAFMSPYKFVSVPISRRAGEKD